MVEVWVVETVEALEHHMGVADSMEDEDQQLA